MPFLNNICYYTGARRKELRSPIAQQAPAGNKAKGTPLDVITVRTMSVIEQLIFNVLQIVLI
jgi:hypothetical protein